MNRWDEHPIARKETTSINEEIRIRAKPPHKQQRDLDIHREEREREKRESHLNIKTTTYVVLRATQKHTPRRILSSTTASRPGGWIFVEGRWRNGASRLSEASGRTRKGKKQRTNHHRTRPTAWFVSYVVPFILCVSHRRVGKACVASLRSWPSSSFFSVPLSPRPPPPSLPLSSLCSCSSHSGIRQTGIWSFVRTTAPF